MLRIIIVTFVIAILFYFAPQMGLQSWIHPKKWEILAFFFAISYLNNLLTQMGLSKNRENFVQFYLGSITARMILSLVFIGIYLYSGMANPNIFVVNFFALYLCYTGFEIYNLYRKLRLFS